VWLGLLGFGFAFPKTLKINQPTHKSWFIWCT